MSPFPFPDSGPSTRFLYTGREFDHETGLQYNRARYYDAAIGRWISEDPIRFGGGDANLYRYVGNSSTNFVDPSGLEQIDWNHDLPKEVMLKLGLIDLDGNTTGEVTGGSLNVHAGEHGTMLPRKDHTDTGGIHAPGDGKEPFDKVFEAKVRDRMKKGKISKGDLLVAKREAKAQFPQFENKPGAPDGEMWPGRGGWRKGKIDDILKDEKAAAKKYGKKIVAEAKERKRLADELNDGIRLAAKKKGVVRVVLKRGTITLGAVIFTYNVATQGVHAACKEAGRDALGPGVDLAEFVAGEIEPHVRELLRGAALDTERQGQQFLHGSRSGDIQGPIQVRPNDLPPAKRRLPLMAERVPNANGDGPALQDEVHPALSILPAHLIRGGTIIVSFESVTEIAELDRIQDAIAFLSQNLTRYGVTLTAAPAGSETTADIRIRIASTSACGTAADGVLGCTEDSGTITILPDWSWYTGESPSGIASNQYDFQTVVTHELGHALGFDHSHDTASVMYDALTTGIARRTLARQDPDNSSDRVHSENQFSQVGSPHGSHHEETPTGAWGCPIGSALRNENLCVPDGTATESILFSIAETSARIESSLHLANRWRYAKHHFVKPEYIIDSVIRADGPYAFSLSVEEDAMGATPDDVLVAGDGDDLQLGEPGRDVLVGGVGVARKSESTGEYDGVVQEKAGAWDVDFSIRDLLQENPAILNCLDT